MQGLFFPLLISTHVASFRNPLQCLIDPRFELPKSGELLKQALVEILEVEGHRSHADGVARTHGLVSLPAFDSVAFDGQQLLNETLLRRTILLRMHADWKLLPFHFSGLNKGLKVNPTLVVVVPTILVQLKVLTTVVDVPVVGKPAGLFQPLFQIAKNSFGVFHRSITRQ